MQHAILHVNCTSNTSRDVLESVDSDMTFIFSNRRLVGNREAKEWLQLTKTKQEYATKSSINVKLLKGNAETRPRDPEGTTPYPRRESFLKLYDLSGRFICKVRAVNDHCHSYGDGVFESPRHGASVFNFDYYVKTFASISRGQNMNQTHPDEPLRRTNGGCGGALALNVENVYYALGFQMNYIRTDEHGQKRGTAKFITMQIVLRSPKFHHLNFVKGCPVQTALRAGLTPHLCASVTGISSDHLVFYSNLSRNLCHAREKSTGLSKFALQLTRPLLRALISALVASSHAKSNLSARVISRSAGKTPASTGNTAVLTDLYAFVNSISDDLWLLNSILRVTYVSTQSTQQPVPYVTIVTKVPWYRTFSASYLMSQNAADTLDYLPKHRNALSTMLTACRAKEREASNTPEQSPMRPPRSGYQTTLSLGVSEGFPHRHRL
ncbi:hypothetical protein EVAR_48735_1 [Eumeta japonica]|uniref:Uncharacterized protein n=1 Tax=Eumeta variegata TaxID=151549 RepID=A0A4C1YL44_EUMVA|nr:hypothetical protein EVAR_48735_1 [Eumeta japonica]